MDNDDKTVHVANVSFSARREDLIAFMRRAGTVVECRLGYHSDTQKPAGYAFVDYATAEEARRAADTLSFKMFRHREVIVTLAQRGIRSRHDQARQAIVGINQLHAAVRGLPVEYLATMPEPHRTVAYAVLLLMTPDYVTPHAC